MRITFLWFLPSHALSLLISKIGSVMLKVLAGHLYRIADRTNEHRVGYAPQPALPLNQFCRKIKL
jgi:hypothetical protein